MSIAPTVIAPSPFCNTHRVLLVRQCGCGPADPWLALEIASMVAIFQGATADDKVYEEIGGDVQRIGELGCLACRKPDLFGKLIDRVQRTFPRARHVAVIKALGEEWIAAATPPKPEGEPKEGGE